MVELYIKRIDKMFANGSFDLRANLLTLSKELFPSLTKIVDRYSDKIQAIVER